MISLPLLMCAYDFFFFFFCLYWHLENAGKDPKNMAKFLVEDNKVDLGFWHLRKSQKIYWPSFHHIGCNDLLIHCAILSALAVELATWTSRYVSHSMPIKKIKRPPIFFWCFKKFVHLRVKVLNLLFFCNSRAWWTVKNLLGNTQGCCEK